MRTELVEVRTSTSSVLVYLDQEVQLFGKVELLMPIMILQFVAGDGFVKNTIDQFSITPTVCFSLDAQVGIFFIKTW